MADFDGVIDPLASWPDVPQISTEAALAGGPGGVLNAQAIALTARLKQLSETLGSINLNPPGDFPAIRPSLLLDFANAGVLDPRIKFSRASTATYVDANGRLRTAAAHEPRLDYDPETGELLGLLQEDAATNLALYSYFQEGDFWGGNASYTLIENVGVAPDGSNTLSRLEAISTGTPYAFPGSTSSVSYTAGRQYVASCWFRFDPNNASRQIRLIMHGNAFGASKSVFFNIQTGKVTTLQSSEPEKWGYKVFPNNFVLVWQVNTATSTTSTYAPLVWFSDTVDAGEGVEFWGIDVKEGNFLSSHIPTRGAAASRAVDLPLLPTGDWFNAAEGTFVVAADTLNDASEGNVRRVFNCSDGTNQNRFDVYLSSVGSGNLYVVSDGTGQGGSMPGNVSPSTPFRIAVGYQGGDIHATIDGGVLGGVSGSPAPVGINQIMIGQSTAVGCLNGHIRQFAYYPRRVSDAQLRILSA